MKNVKIIEVCPRDGFQNVDKFIPTEIKIKVIDGLVEAGFKRIQVTSFVHPKIVPQMRDAKEVTREVIKKYPNIEFSALVPNLFGAKVAYEAGIRKISYVISASEAHNKQNVRRTIEESFEELTQIRKNFENLTIKIDIATAFGCPFQGEIPVEQILKMIEKSLEIGVDYIFLADTIGIANPKQVREILEIVNNKYTNIDFGLHLHDTRGMGLANALVAFEKGFTTFESAAGGLGGCPFAPGAAGNIASEDLINMLEHMNISTGINLDKLIDTTDFIKRNIKSDLTGHLANICRKNLF